MFNVNMASTVKTKITRHQLYYKSIMAGICISLGCIGLAFVKSDSPLPTALSGILGGVIFSFGLFTIFTLGFELFTGNFLMFASYADDKVSLKDIFRVQGWTLLGNIIGCVTIYLIFKFCNFSYESTLRALANSKVDLRADWLIARGILCNVVICLSSLISMRENGIVQKFIAAVLPVILFVSCGFEHSIADAFILLFSSLEMYRVLLCFLAVVIGNTCGGLLVAVYYYNGVHRNEY